MNSEGTTYLALPSSGTPRLAGASTRSQWQLALAAALMAFLGTTAAPAWARIYRHVDPMTGAIVYSNYRVPAQRNNTWVALPPPVPPTPAPPSVPHTPDVNPTRRTTRVEEVVTVKRTSDSRPTSSTFTEFPRVSAETQRERDSERRRLLKQELSTEQAALDQAIERKAASDILQRHRANIEALNREIARVQ